MTRMERLLVTVSFGPIESARNGYFVRMLNLLEVLSRLYKYVVVLEYVEDGCGSECYRPRRVMDNVISIPLPGNQRGPRLLHYLRLGVWQLINTLRLRRLLARADTVLIGSALFVPTMLVARVVARGPYIVLEPHMLFAERAERKGLRGVARLLRLAEGIVYRMSDLIIALSPEMKHKLRKIYSVARVVTVPFQLPEPLRSPAACPETTPRRNTTCTVFFIGSLEAPQNLEAALYLVATAAAVSRVTGSRVRILIAGRAPREARSIIEELAERSGVEAKLLGYVENPDPYACSADILAAPMFTMSGVSTKMLYYLRFRGKKIIASSEALEGLRYMARLHGGVVEARDPIEFARIMAEECIRLGIGRGKAAERRRP